MTYPMPGRGVRHMYRRHAPARTRASGCFWRQPCNSSCWRGGWAGLMSTDGWGEQARHAGAEQTMD